MDPRPTPAEMTEHLFARWNAKDAGAFGAFFPEDGEFNDVIGQHAEGPQEIARMHTPAFARLFAQAELTCTSVRVRELAEGLASVDAAWRMTGQVSPVGDPLPAREGNMHLIAVRRDGGWLPLTVHNLDFGGVYESVRRPGVGRGLLMDDAR